MSKPDASDQRVLLLGWNLASWEIINPLLDGGQLPNLQSLVENGVMGSLRTQRPLINHVVYNSLATGKYADKHGVFGPLEVGTDNSIRQSDSLSRHTDAFWEVLSDNDIRCNVINFPFTGPAEKVNGVFVAPSFFESIPGSYGEDSEIPPLSVTPESELESLRQFIVSLEDIDAEIMSSFVPRFRELDTDDPRLIAIGAAAAHTFSVHAVVTWLMEHTPWDVTCVSYDLMDFLGKDFFQYHIPNSGQIDEAESESNVNRFRMSVHLFSDVVTSAIRLCDRLLGRMLELAGENTTVIIYSPWGMMNKLDLSARDDAANATYSESVYRGEGIFLMREPRMPNDELLHQVGFLDICPTVLRSCGLGIDADVDGCPVQDYVEHKVKEPNRSGAWTPDGLRAPATDFTRTISRPQVIRFNDAFSEKIVRRVEEENLWTLAAVQVAADRREEVLPLLLRLYHANPLRVERGYLVVEALYHTGYLKESLGLMQSLATVFANNPTGQFMAGFVALSNGNLDRAKEMFERAEANNPPFPILFYYLGQVYLLLDLPDNAIQAFSRFLELDPCLPHAYLGLSEALLRAQRFEEAAEAALSAVGARFSEPAMHLALGRAMAQLGDKERAIEAYETAIRLVPNHQLAHDHLDWLDQYFNEAIRDPAKHTWRSLTPPLHPQLGGKAVHNAKVKEAMQEINEWRNVFIDELETAERRLDEYIAQNLKRRSDAVKSPPGAVGDDSDPVALFRKENWVVRPVEPSDQSAIHHMSFNNPFMNPSEKEILVTHPVGSNEIRGAVMLEWTTSQPTQVRLRLSVGSTDLETGSGPTKEQTQMWLFRAGLARAAAGGVEQVTVAFKDDESQTLSHQSLEQYGFESTKCVDIYMMNLGEMRAVGLALLERYRKRKRIPEDIRVVTLDEVPFEKVDQFFRQWFTDGAGITPDSYSQTFCPIMVKGNDIIACCIGYAINSKIGRATRLAVLPEYRRAWATAWLIEAGSRIVGGGGWEFLEFYNDGDRFPEFARIATRQLNAKHLGVSRTMKLDLNHPW